MVLKNIYLCKRADISLTVVKKLTLRKFNHRKELSSNDKLIL
jgi:hypothetical protein